MASSKVMPSDSQKRSTDDVWRDIVAGRPPKVEQVDRRDQMMTLEDFLVKAGAADPDEVAPQPPVVKVEENQERVMYRLGVSGYGSGEWRVEGGGRGRGRRRLGGEMGMGVDRAAEQRHRRMIKNRESAARSRERKQAYQSELESLAEKLEEEHQRLLKEKEVMNKQRLKLLMETVIPVVEKRKPPRVLKRTRSMEW